MPGVTKRESPINCIRMMKNISLVILFVLLPGFCFAQNWDIDLLKHINLHRDRSLDMAFQIVTDYAAPLAYSLPVFLYLLSIVKKSSVLKQKSIFMIQAALMTLLIVTMLKYVVNRPRPFVTYPFIQKITSGGSPSFPSGHTADAFVIAVSATLLFSKNWKFILPVWVWAFAVAYSRMALGVHYPSDVLGSMCIGAATAIFLFQFFKKRNASSHGTVAEND